MNISDASALIIQSIPVMRSFQIQKGDFCNSELYKLYAEYMSL